MGGPGGLVVNTASCAAFTFDMKFERSGGRRRNILLLKYYYISSISYQISKHGVAVVTRSFGSQDSVSKTGVKVG